MVPWDQDAYVGHVGVRQIRITFKGRHLEGLSLFWQNIPECNPINLNDLWQTLRAHNTILFVITSCIHRK
jgi:hypothetical protein